MKTRIVLILITLLCAAMANLQNARAATITVSNTNDSGPGSLRQALVDANDGDTINFDSSLNGQTITLTSGELNVDKDVTISGPGADNLAVDGNAQSRVFYVNPGKTVTIEGVTVANGSDSGRGGIWNDGASLTVSNCTISGNSGGGISNEHGGSATVSDCVISGNSGGGIFNGLGITTLTITNCTIRGNSADYYGGGILNYAVNAGGTVTVTNCVISGNSAGVSGGGIFNVGHDGGVTLTISNSTLSGNSAGVSGGGIYSGAGGGNSGYSTVTVSNSTISGNSAPDGGGIWNAGGNRSFAGVAVSNSTVSGNSATGNGGGVYNQADNTSLAAVETGNTIFDAGSSGENIYNYAGTVTSLGYNVSSDNGGGYLTGPGDQINTDPLLGPLQDNGGPTFTHALLPGSPAINAGDPNFTPPPFYDQRGPGFDRVVNGRIDIGSFEVQGPTPTPRPLPTPRPRSTPRPRP